MINRIMFCAHASENTISIRTISARMKSPQQFYICFEVFDQLQQYGRIISSDSHSFAAIRLDERRDRIVFDFTGLTGHSYDRVEGVEQTVALHWSAFQAFLQDCRQDVYRMDGVKRAKKRHFADPPLAVVPVTAIQE